MTDRQLSSEDRALIQKLNNLDADASKAFVFENAEIRRVGTQWVVAVTVGAETSEKRFRRPHIFRRSEYTRASIAGDGTVKKPAVYIGDRYTVSDNDTGTEFQQPTGSVLIWPPREGASTVDEQ